MNSLNRFLSDHQIAFLVNENLAPYTTFRIGGPARWLALPSSARQLQLLQQWVMQNRLPFFLLGGGSNLLVSDSGFDGLVIHPRFEPELQIISQDQHFLTVELAASGQTTTLGRKISRLGYSGFEFLSTIPGSLGGALVQNAGCYGYEISQCLLEVKACQHGKELVLPAPNCDFAYRSSLFKKDNSLWISSATFRLPAASLAEIENHLADFKERRKNSQPQNHRSAGSVFKNPPGQSAWRLIDQAGLRGQQAGQAWFSPEHSNFIVNRGKARAADVYQLILLAEQKVKEQSGITLEREVILLGDF